MADRRFAVALIHEVFHGVDGSERLAARLIEAREAGAELAVLPELPMNRWSPATRTAESGDAEPPDGPRRQTMAEAARRAGVAVLGGVIRRDPTTGRRTNRALLFDRRGELVASYDKLHLPSEDGFWESDHYEPGNTPPRAIDGFPFRFGIQICSDLNRPEGCHMLGAMGVEAVLAPRATPSASYDFWKTVMRVDAMTSGTYVLSANRPGPEPGVDVGGPSIAVGPDGSVLLESTDPLSVVTLESTLLRDARQAYPGYLAVRADIYARGWREI